MGHGVYIPICRLRGTLSGIRMYQYKSLSRRYDHLLANTEYPEILSIVLSL
jgi:hypothetical protein